MIIDDEIIRVQYESTAESPIIVGDVLPVPYGFTEKEQLNAVLSNGTNLVYKQDYTVGDTSITLSVDIPIGETITIYRSTPLDQCSEFPQEAKFNSKKIEDALDKLTMQNQEQREALSRALKLPLTASTDISDLSLPSPVPNKAVKWNSDGTALVNTDFDSDLALVLTEQYKDQAQQAAVKAENQQNIATEQAGIATDKADAAANSATQAAETLAAAVTTIATEKEEAIEAVQNQQVNSINAVKAQQNTSIDAVKAQQNTSINALKAEGTTQVNLAKAEVTKATNQANDAKNYAAVANSAADTAKATLNAAKAEITAEKTIAVNAVKTQQSTSVSAVQKQQTSSVNTVKSTGQSYVDKCKAWASSDRIVEGGLYSAKHYAEMAQGKSDVTYEHLRASRVYNDKGMLLTDEEGYADVAEMNRSTFDLSKFKVVGSPTITEDGVASGFTGGSTISTTSQNVNTVFQVEMNIKIGTFTGDTTQYVFRGYRGTNEASANLLIANTNKLWLVGYTTEGVYTNIGHVIIQENIEYKIKAVFSNTFIEYYVNDEFVIKSVGNFKIPTFIKMGDTMAFKGSIDLKQISITVDGVEVFNGNKTGLDIVKPDNYIVAGNMNITNDGISKVTTYAGNYIDADLSITNAVANSKDFSCSFSFVAKEGFDYWGKWYDIYSVNIFKGYGSGTDKTPVIGIFIHGLASIIGGDGYITRIGLKFGSTYYFKFTRKDSYINVVIKENNKQVFNYEFNDYIDSNTPSNYIRLRPFADIDLNSFKIYVDDKLVYQPCLKIPYNISENGAKIVPAYARDRLLDVYEQYGNEYNYYTIDEENKNFTLPIGNDYDNSARPSLENVNNRGNEKLATSLMYETGNVSNDEKGYKQLTKMNRSTFDKSKFTVVGSPTITSDGIASGFSLSNYLKTPNIININSNNFKIIALIDSGSSITSPQNQTIWSIGEDGQRITLNFNEGVFNLASGYVQFAGITQTIALTPNTVYKLIVEVDGVNVILSIFDVNNNLLIKKSTPLNSTYSVGNHCFIGRSSLSGGNALTGSIDLKQFSITVDGKEVFSGNKTGLDIVKPDNYTVVGSPVISEDGVASGLNSNNYITVPMSNIDFTKPFKIITKLKTPSSSIDNDRHAYWSLANNYTSSLWFWKTTSGGNLLGFYLAVGTNPTAIKNFQFKGAKFNTEYTVILEWTGISYAFSVLHKNNTIYTDVQFNSNALYGASSIATLMFGGTNLDAYTPTPLSSIDLNSFKIYVDDQLVYQPCLKIPYNVSKTGSKIVPAYARGRVIDLYEQEGHAGYYTIDEEKKNFTLPMGEIFGLIGQRSLRSVTRDGANYCEIYSDKTIEQGGTCTANVEVTLQQPFADRNYVLSVPYSSKTATSFIPTQTGDWIAKGKGV